MRRARDLIDGWSPIPSDRLAVLAFDNLVALAARTREIVRTNLGLVSEWLSSVPQLECVVPRATLAFPRLRGGSDAGPFVDRLFTDTGTAVAPGHFFGAPAHFRIALGGHSAKLTKGLETIRRVLETG
jgi:aspartate/methionine/tyrosine aminotransferase